MSGTPRTISPSRALRAAVLAACLVGPFNAAAEPVLPEAPQATRAQVDFGAALPPPMPLTQSPGQALAHLGATQPLSPFGMPCEPHLRAEARPGAVLSLTLEAACRPEQDVTLLHGGMELPGRLGPLGTLAMELPGLEPEGRVEVRFDDGETLSAAVPLRDLSMFRRVLLQWQGDEGLELHAREIAHGRGGTLEIWRRNRSDLRVAMRGQGGALSVLQADAARLESYTAPKTLGTVRLSLQGRVTPANCGRTLAATVFRTTPASAQPERQDLRLRMPGCDRVGEKLRLRNVLPDLKHARY